MTIIIIANYPKDRQESMKRFAQMLQKGFVSAGVRSEIWHPLMFFGLFVRSTHFGLGKWLAYIDKFFIFPFVLTIRLMNKRFKGSDLHFHICDHGNAPYLNYLPKGRTVITCHDVLAIREALGYPETYTPVSPIGKYFQKWIFYHLSSSKLLATVSESTLKQLLELIEGKFADSKTWKVIHNALNAEFYPMDPEQRDILLEEAGLDLSMPFILHVGSNNVRKNRKLLIEMVKELGEHWNGIICFAGEEIGKDLASYAESLSLNDRLISVVNPDHLTLVALYNGCDALVFPSYSEGFGWPLIEAQACGTPVIASRIPPLQEVGSDGCLYANPHMPSEFANQFLMLEDRSIRAEVIRRGLNNVKRFDIYRMVEKYLELHGRKKLELLETIQE
jgi:glycosyltransferase involved in cell wall biosynthesis